MQQLIELSDIAKEKFGIDIIKFLTKEENDEKKNILTVWSSIYACDYVVYHSYIKAGYLPNCYLGYSMGLITALACAGSITFINGIEILKVILSYHKVKEEEGMATIIGFTKNELLSRIKECSCEKQVNIACENNDYCFGISGIKKSVDKVCEYAAENGAFKIISIENAFAFHTDMFKEGSELLKDFVDKLEVKNLEVPVISSLDQRYLYNTKDLKNELVCNMFSNIIWKRSIEILSASGPVDFLEVSLGKSLSKVSKLINSENQYYSYNSIFDK